jgi:hypothetical protein
MLMLAPGLGAGLYARVPLLARAQDQRSRACKALAAARASGPEGADKVVPFSHLHCVCSQEPCRLHEQWSALGGSHSC